MARSDDPLILIEYAAIRNKNPHKDGWIPMAWNNGRELLDAWSPRDYDKDVALRMAKREAKREAAHYSGDWDIRIRVRRAPKASLGLAGSMLRICVLNVRNPDDGRLYAVRYKTMGRCGRGASTVLVEQPGPESPFRDLFYREGDRYLKNVARLRARLRAAGFTIPRKYN